MGYGLFLAQKGEKHRKAKPLKGFAGAGTLEMISDHRGNTYRAVYTVRLAHVVYVPHKRAIRVAILPMTEPRSSHYFVRFSFVIRPLDNHSATYKFPCASHRGQ
ncbi:MAG TPA: type II toxin-antitoxin system RelE/ParE family toxin [Blastocatellia bacterium]|nr:type II toxin-antitoxin system RelE/ParE family toxin [Blastocatellia bacterium]